VHLVIWIVKAQSAAIDTWIDSLWRHSHGIWAFKTICFTKWHPTRDPSRRLRLSNVQEVSSYRVDNCHQYIDILIINPAYTSSFFFLGLVLLGLQANDETEVQVNNTTPHKTILATITPRLSILSSPSLPPQSSPQIRKYGRSPSKKTSCNCIQGEALTLSPRESRRWEHIRPPRCCAHSCLYCSCEQCTELSHYEGEFCMGC
jgi:hypothetical protein